MTAQNPEGKKLCKYYVQRGLGLASEGILDGNRVLDTTHKVPLVVCITRLVPQKGLHLISRAIKRVEELVSVSCSMSHVVLSEYDCLTISFKPSSQFYFNWFPSFSMEFLLGCSDGHTWENFRWSGWKRIWRACKIGIGFEIFVLHIVLEFINFIGMTRHTMKQDMCVCVYGYTWCVILVYVTPFDSFVLRVRSFDKFIVGLDCLLTLCACKISRWSKMNNSHI